MNRTKHLVSNAKGNRLAVYIEFPGKQKPKHFAIVSHCFTCNSYYHAVRYITRSLNQSGIAVVRFDFTGLGKSEGEFKDSHFAANVDDLLTVYHFIAKRYQAPEIMIGHSLGGAASLVAASQIDTVKAVCTIGSPADVKHTTKHFASQVDKQNPNELSKVHIDGREFSINQDFVDGFHTYDLAEIIPSIRKPILIMHSPVDIVVDIKNAHKIYTLAKHPKSFVTLDKADHLLTKKKYCRYVGQMIASWVGNYLEVQEEEVIDPEEDQIVAHLEPSEDNLTTRIYSKKHGLIADEPNELGGDDFGMSPYELLSSGLAACTTMTISMYATRKGLDVKEVQVYVSHSKQLTESGEKQDVFHKTIQLEGNLTDAQKNRILDIAERCPVSRTLIKGASMQSRLEE